MIFYTFLLTYSLISVQVTWEHACISENICLYPQVYIWRTLHPRKFYLSSGYFITIRKSSNLPQDFGHKSVQFILNNQSWFAATCTCLCIQFYYLWWVFFLFSSYYSMSTLLFLSSQPFLELIKRWESPQQQAQTIQCLSKQLIYQHAQKVHASMTQGGPGMLKIAQGR